MSLLSALSFGNPIALWGLLSIPGIWILLKIYPPVPKTIFFPALRFLNNIRNEELIVMIWANEIYDPSNPDTFSYQI